ncbi:COQ9 family protein [Pelagovum pacificum]|uniref:COQ9 family protein n=1 Tax=Pelagovum pacificum TaxID=2588711 RepID=A0A5C5GC89_9RHOB|nr:COQ9 family protein [Pelagovum pacificum]QQA42510.1 COQ9 family protein [Pelagovum pacificum]TNY31594.1 COQ9 family protein [Pelagovum pacificum]
MNAPPDPKRVELLDAILPHVAFDGWSEKAFREAISTVGVTPAEARRLCPKGAVDLAADYHRRGDEAARADLMKEDLSTLRFRDKVARAVRVRIDAITDKEAVRRGTAMFSLPHLALEGSRLIWGTADMIWTTLGDSSDDLNWYTKRMSLSGVYGATVLYWLGDDSLDQQATDDFIDRRIGDVMQIEKVKAQVNQNSLLRPFTAPLARLSEKVRAPRGGTPPMDMPGSWVPPKS